MAIPQSAIYSTIQGLEKDIKRLCAYHNRFFFSKIIGEIETLFMLSIISREEYWLYNLRIRSIYFQLTK